MRVCQLSRVKLEDDVLPWVCQPHRFHPAVPCLPLLPLSLVLGDPADSGGGFCPLLPQCVSSGQHTPSETFKIADSHPEVEDRVEPLSPTKSPLFHNKHRYQKIGVHKVSAADGCSYNVLYLATGTGDLSLRGSPGAAFPWRVRNPREADEPTHPPAQSEARGCVPSPAYVRQELPDRSAANSSQAGCTGNGGLKAEPQRTGFARSGSFSLWWVSGQALSGPGRGNAALPGHGNPLQRDPLQPLLSLPAAGWQPLWLEPQPAHRSSWGSRGAAGFGQGSSAAAGGDGGQTAAALRLGSRAGHLTSLRQPCSSLSLRCVGCVQLARVEGLPGVLVSCSAGQEPAEVSGGGPAWLRAHGGSGCSLLAANLPPTRRAWAGQLPTLAGAGGEARAAPQHLGGPNPCLTRGHTFDLPLDDGGEGSDCLGSANAGS